MAQKRSNRRKCLNSSRACGCAQKPAAERAGFPREFYAEPACMAGIRPEPERASIEGGGEIGVSDCWGFLLSWSPASEIEDVMAVSPRVSIRATLILHWWVVRVQGNLTEQAGKILGDHLQQASSGIEDSLSKSSLVATSTLSLAGCSCAGGLRAVLLDFDLLRYYVVQVGKKAVLLARD